MKICRLKISCTQFIDHAKGYTGLHLSAQYCYIRYIATFKPRPKTGITLIKFEAKEQVQDVIYQITKGHPAAAPMSIPSCTVSAIPKRVCQSQITGTERTMQIPRTIKDKLILQAYFCVCLVQQAAFGSVKLFFQCNVQTNNNAYHNGKNVVVISNIILSFLLSAVLAYRE